MRDVLRLVKQILREQEDGSDYDDLYFGMQDVRDLLEDKIIENRERIRFDRKSSPPGRSKTKSTRTRNTGKSSTRAKPKRTKKQKLLDKMAAEKWDKYKKGKGKKTYVKIRSEVSRSIKFKKAVKRL